VQEALLRGYQKLESFESRSNFGTWIYRIAVRCALDRISNRKGDKASRAAEESDPEQDEVQLAALEAKDQVGSQSLGSKSETWCDYIPGQLVTLRHGSIRRNSFEVEMHQR
jgi:DNA-directed RNA polymerase specialized sigma24 family protein